MTKTCLLLVNLRNVGILFTYVITFCLFDKACQLNLITMHGTLNLCSLAGVYNSQTNRRYNFCIYILTSHWCQIIRQVMFSRQVEFTTVSPLKLSCLRTGWFRKICYLLHFYPNSLVCTCPVKKCTIYPNNWWKNSFPYMFTSMVTSLKYTRWRHHYYWCRSCYMRGSCVVVKILNDEANYQTTVFKGNSLQLTICSHHG